MENVFKLSVICICLTFFVLTGCAKNSGIVKIGEETYKVTRQAASGFVGSGGIRDAALSEASEFCIGKGKEMKVIRIGGNHPPYILGNFPKVEVQFSCLDANDPRLKKEAEIVLEKSNEISIDVKTKEQSEKTRDVYTELIKLDDLRKRDIITEKEFITQKKKLLSGD